MAEVEIDNSKLLLEDKDWALIKTLQSLIEVIDKLNRRIVTIGLR